MEYLDPVKNLLSSTIATAPSPADTGTTFSVTAGTGNDFPDPASDGEYNLVICPAGAAPTVSNATIVRVTARSGDQFTVTRDVENSNSRNVEVGDMVAMNITAKMMEDIDSELADKEDADATILKQADVINDTNSTDVDKPLSAAQGKALQEEVDVRIVMADNAEIVRVGPGEDYTTINAALKYLTEKYPQYNNGDDTRAIIRLNEDFYMEEQVLVNGQELGWIAIDSEAGTGQAIEGIVQGTQITGYERPEISRVRIPSYAITWVQDYDDEEPPNPVGDPYLTEDATVLNGSWVSLQLANGNEHYFWINVNDEATDPGLDGTGHEVVVDEDDENDAAASALKNAINGVSGVGATVSDNVIEITNDNWGAVKPVAANGIVEATTLQAGRDEGYRAKIEITGHGFDNGDRIIIKDHSGDVEERDYNGVWYVVGKTDNDFQLDYDMNPGAVYDSERAGSVVSGEAVSPEPVMVSREALSERWEFFYRPAFGIARGTLPTIACEFEMDETGDNGYMSYKDGLCATDQGKINIMPFCGFSKAGGSNIYGTRASIINANDAIANEAGRHGVWAYSNTIVNARRVEANNCGWEGVSEDTGNGFDSVGRPVGCGMVATRLSLINAEGAQVSGSQGDNYLAEFGGQINCEGHDSNASSSSPVNGRAFNVRRGVIYRNEGLVTELNSWIPIFDEITYDSTDDPTGVVNWAGADQRVSPGMRLKFDNDGNTIYAIVTAVTSTKATFLHEMETDGSGNAAKLIADEPITNVYYSTQKAPQGFPLSPTKWTKSVEDGYTNEDASPGTYNVASLDVPTGEWIINYSGYVRTSYHGSDWRASTWGSVRMGTTPAGSDIEGYMFNWYFQDHKTNSHDAGGFVPFAYTELASLSSDGSRHISVHVGNTGATTYKVYGYSCIIKATCAYL